MGYNVYSPEDDARILEAAEKAKRAGIPLNIVFDKLAEELEPTRSGGSVYARYRKYLIGYATPRGVRDQIELPFDDGEPGDVLGQIRALVKQRDYYKKQYESMVESYDGLVRETKELKEIRRLLGRVTE